MTNRLKWLLQAGAVALVAACGGTASDDVVIRTDVESSGAPGAAATTQVDTPATPAASDLKNERNGR